MKPHLAIRWLGAVLFLLGFAASQARAQGFLIDRRPHVPIAGTFQINAVAIDARVRDQVAEVQVSQTFHNPGSFVLESEYLFPLPEAGAIQNFVLLVDGKELAGRLLPKEEASRIYEEVVRSKRDPALLEYMGRGMYRTRVFPIPPGADRTVTLRYTQLCRRDGNAVEFAYPLATQKVTSSPIRRLALDVRIESKEPIKSIYSPSSSPRIDRTGDHSARISLEEKDAIPTADFRLLYTLEAGDFGATVLSDRPSRSEDGFFLLLASPKIEAADETPRPKSVVFVLDRSSSMAGKKIEQARNALKFVLENLRDDDRFNIVVYADAVETFREGMVRYQSGTRREALRFVENIREGGTTNIDEALRTSMGLIDEDPAVPCYVLFLTDGLPTAGETREMSIVEACRKANRAHARLFAFGVGFDVNARLLDRLSGGNSGTSEYVKPDEDIEAHVGRFSSRMTRPVLSGIRVTLDDVDVNRTYPRDVPDLFEGGQLVLSGRYREGGKAKLRISGRVGSERRSYEFPVDLATSEGRGRRDYIARIWATRRIGDLIDEIDLRGQNKELVDELVALSTRYGILTPYTSYLADETTRLDARAENRMRTGLSLEKLDEVSGAAGVSQRSAKQRFRDADRPQDTYALAPGIVGEGVAPAPRSMRGGMGRLQGGAVARAPAPAAPASRPLGTGGPAAAFSPQKNQLAMKVEDTSGNQRLVTTVRQVGAKTFFFKDDHWVDSTLTAADETHAREIAQFSKAYFDLARGQDAEFNQYMAFDEPVTVRLGEDVYRITAPSP